jgi:hypothetical protein
MSDIELPTTSSVVKWAECFEKYKQDNGWSIDDIDEGLMMTWFANFWACIYTPLQTRIETLEADRDNLTKQLTTWREINDKNWQELMDVAKAKLEKARGETEAARDTGADIHEQLERANFRANEAEAKLDQVRPFVKELKDIADFYEGEAGMPRIKDIADELQTALAIFYEGLAASRG